MLAQSTCHYNGPDIIVSGKKTWDHSKCAGLVRGIQNYHMDAKGWSDIAYNFIICPHGYTFEGRGLNTYNGANGTTSGNKSSHAVMCLAGEGNTFTDAEKVEFRQCVEYVVSKTKCHSGCMGHRDHKSTACPGDIRYKWVHAGMPVPKPTSEPVPEPIPDLRKASDAMVVIRKKNPTQRLLLWNGMTIVGHDPLVTVTPTTPTFEADDVMWELLVDSAKYGNTFVDPRPKD
jgi:hypothetical protein